MKYTENSINILTAKSYSGIGNAWIIKNLKGNDKVEFIVDQLNNKINCKTNLDEFDRKKKEFENILIQKFENYCDGFVAYGDHDFPKHRGTVKDSERPVFLYYKGDISLLKKEKLAISVIGLLNPAGDIEIRERELVKEFVKNGAIIVSGLALGCDSISHIQALESNGKTIAILPSPLNNILPSSNLGLASRIISEGGLIISEYGKQFKSPMELSSRYKERDRLQAIFCDTIVLAASYSKNSADIWGLHGQKLDSGARLAMEYAKQYNISRAVMYEKDFDSENPMFDLNREIISEDNKVKTISMEKLSNEISTILLNINNKNKSRNEESDLTNKLF